MHEILEKISAIGIVPVIKIDDPETAVPLAKALCEGGLPCAEITFRTAQAEESIRRIAQAVPDMLVGAGTVLTTDQVDRAVSAGAKFIVSPGLNPRTVSIRTSPSHRAPPPPLILSGPWSWVWTWLSSFPLRSMAESRPSKPWQRHTPKSNLCPPGALTQRT